MGKIILLDENTSNQIAAGEVIERPASVVKELVENAIDAGADNITVEIKNGGIKFIKVIDNGSGIDTDDIEIAFERHSTSKIKGARDLDNIRTLGFRGEALASIASVSKITLITKTDKDKNGKRATLKAGDILEISNCGTGKGTTFIIEDLFFNTPARFKFLKKDMTEARYISDTVMRIALGNPDIRLKLINNGKTAMQTVGDNKLDSAIYSVYGRDMAKDILRVSHEGENISIKGYIGRETIAKASRKYQSIFINKRYIKSSTIAAALDQGFSTYLMKNKFPFAVLDIDINPGYLDVNVHPAKTEIRFSDEKYIFREVYIAVRNALESGRNYNDITLEKPVIAEKVSYKAKEKNRKTEEKAEVSEPVTEYINQQTINVYNELKKDNLFKSINDKEKTVIENEEEIQNKNTENAPNEEEIQDKSLVSSIVEEEKEKQEYSELLESKYIGSIFNTYIILEINDELMFLDQHAAHERIVYERLKEKHEKNEKLSQVLLESIIVSMEASEYSIYKEYEKELKETGFETEDFGDNSVIIRSIPIEYKGINSNSFKEILSSLDDLKTEPDYEKVLKTACKIAIKANDAIKESEVLELLTELSKCENPYHCPHGRPTAFKISKTELEKKIRRKI
jgi:DNA mismatch repair protein MutL